MKVKLAATIACLAISCSAQAAVFVQNSDLPTALQGKFGSMAASSFNTTNMAAFGYMENAVAKWLIRYSLVSPSNRDGQPLSGSLWLTANNTYNLNNNTNNFTLYTEKTSPSNPNSFWGMTTLGLSLDNTALGSGGGYFQAGLDWSNNSYAEGNLTVSNALYCVAEGCSFGAKFNLVNLKYINSGNLASLTFNPLDQRGLVFEETMFDPYANSGSGYQYRQQYYAHPTPLPAGLWLFASGFVGLGALARKRKATAQH